MELTSSIFENRGEIPLDHTCDGSDASPPLTIAEVPAGAQSLVLIVDDPDAPGGDWVHWVVWNLPPDTTVIARGQVPTGAVEGTTDFGQVGYGGPCPPSGTHRYFFRLYALNSVIELPATARKDEVDVAMEGHVLEEAALVGTYGRG